MREYRYVTSRELSEEAYNLVNGSYLDEKKIAKAQVLATLALYKQKEEDNEPDRSSYYQ